MFRVHADDFLRPASVRFEHGRQDPDAYLEDRLDAGALGREVLDPFVARGRFLPTLWDAVADRSTRAAFVDAPERAVLVLDGSLLLGRWLDADLTVHLTVRPSTLARRTPAEDRWTLPAFARYDEETLPTQRRGRRGPRRRPTAPRPGGRRATTAHAGTAAVRRAARRCIASASSGRADDAQGHAEHREPRGDPVPGPGAQDGPAAVVAEGLDEGVPAGPLRDLGRGHVDLGLAAAGPRVDAAELLGDERGDVGARAAARGAKRGPEPVFGVIRSTRYVRQSARSRS